VEDEKTSLVGVSGRGRGGRRGIGRLLPARSAQPTFSTYKTLDERSGDTLPCLGSAGDEAGGSGGGSATRGKARVSASSYV